MTSSTQKFVKKVQIGITCTSVDRKMKIKSKMYFEENYSFMKPLSYNFEVLTQFGYLINPKLAQKRAQTCFSCTTCNRKMKIKSLKNFKMRYLFMKLVSQNLEILAPCCDVIISNWVKKTQIWISCTTYGKNIKIRNYKNFSICFWNSFPLKILIHRKYSLQDILGAFGISLHKKCLNFRFLKKSPS